MARIAAIWVMSGVCHQQGGLGEPQRYRAEGQPV